MLPLERNALDGITGFGTESWTVELDEGMKVEVEFIGEVARIPEFNGDEDITEFIEDTGINIKFDCGVEMTVFSDETGMTKF